MPGARLVLWAHNSHLGDARATDMGHSGELNVGQHGQLKLLNVPRHVRQFLAVTKLGTILTSFENERAAIGSFDQP